MRQTEHGGKGNTIRLFHKSEIWDKVSLSKVTQEVSGIQRKWILISWISTVAWLIRDILPSVLFRTIIVLFYIKAVFSLADLPYMRKQIHAPNLYLREQLSESVWTTSSPVPIYLQVVWNEDFASFLNHWLWFQLFFREFALTRVKHLLARNTGKSKICRVRFVANRNLDSLRINGTRCVSVCWQDLTYRNKG